MKREKKVLKFTEFMEQLGKIVDDTKLLLRVSGDHVFVDGKFFHESTINRIQRLLQLYGECEWWIYPSDTLQGGVMYVIKIFIYK